MEPSIVVPTITRESLPVPSFGQFTGVASPDAILSVVVTFIFIWWAIYTLVVVYHWIRFGRESWVAIPAIALHIFVSGWIFVFATGGLH